MSILIKGIEMPKSCRDCRFCGGQANMDYGVCAWCRVDGKAHDAYARQDCPLIFVPEPHGRLIDAERLKEVFHRNVASGEAFDQLIDIAPTIIPASEKEE